MKPKRYFQNYVNSPSVWVAILGFLSAMQRCFNGANQLNEVKINNMCAKHKYNNEFKPRFTTQFCWVITMAHINCHLVIWRWKTIKDFEKLGLFIDHNEFVDYSLRQCFSTDGPRPTCGHGALLVGHQAFLFC